MSRQSHRLHQLTYKKHGPVCTGTSEQGERFFCPFGSERPSGILVNIFQCLWNIASHINHIFVGVNFLILLPIGDLVKFQEGFEME